MYYEVIRDFSDLQDDGYIYRVGDVFPHGDDVVDNARLLELSTTANKRGMILIKAVREADDPEDAPEASKTADDPEEASETAEIQPESEGNEVTEESVAEPEKAPKKRKKEK